MNNLRKFLSIFQSPALRYIARWAGCIRGRLFIICILNVLMPLCSLGITLATKGLVDGAVSRGLEGLRQYGLLLIVLVFIQQAFGILESVIALRAQTRLRRQMQGLFSQALLRKEYEFIKTYHSGELVNRFFSDIRVVEDGVMEILPSFICSGVSFIGSLVILISIDWRLILLMIAGGVFSLGVMLLFRNPIKWRHKRRREAEEKLHITVQETFENIRLLKASLSEKRAFRKIDSRQLQLERAWLSQGYFSLIMRRGMGLVLNVSWLFCMIWGCYGIFLGRFSYGSLAMIIQLIDRIELPFIEAFELAGQAYAMTSSAERIQEMTDLPEEVQGDNLTDFDIICLKNISFRYSDGNEDVLQNVTFSVQKGDVIALTGISGGGKTSLFQLLLGIYRPTSGQLTVRLGKKTVPASRGTRALFAYVPQGNTLFSGSLRENLLMFTDEASEEEIEAAVQCACIDGLVKDIGLDAVLGEHGVGLSEGQAQRVAVARALLCGAPILLLDEATSALDEETEARLLDNISRLHGKTCLIVTHRRAALAICSRRIHLHDGRMTSENSVDISTGI